MAAHQRQQATVLTGDISISCPGGRPTPGPFNVDGHRARRALTRLVALRPRIAGLGHGRPLLDNATEGLRGALTP
ncbi:hypothetical protein [Actinoplanes sp. NPDC051494]|uniref:hypothetical protein n=1 Tax=Actinoplanes sp. NPDC051494 TaxID=3363907 RepID=UPI00378B657B